MEKGIFSRIQSESEEKKSSEGPGDGRATKTSVKGEKTRAHGMLGQRSHAKRKNEAKGRGMIGPRKRARGRKETRARGMDGQGNKTKKKKESPNLSVQQIAHEISSGA